MTASEAARIVNSRICRCGANKIRKVALCGACYDILPDELRRALWPRIGRGFEAGYEAASAYLAAQHAAETITS